MHQTGSCNGLISTRGHCEVLTTRTTTNVISTSRSGNRDQPAGNFDPRLFSLLFLARPWRQVTIAEHLSRTLSRGCRIPCSPSLLAHAQLCRLDLCRTRGYAKSNILIEYDAGYVRFAKFAEDGGEVFVEERRNSGETLFGDLHSKHVDSSSSSSKSNCSRLDRAGTRFILWRCGIPSAAFAASSLFLIRIDWQDAGILLLLPPLDLQQQVLFRSPVFTPQVSDTR